MTGFLVAPRAGDEAPSLRPVLDAMEHRGPFTATHHTGFAVAVQLDGSPTQVARKGDLSLVGDIRLDNRAALLEMLDVSPSTPDRELVLSAFAAYGPDVCPRLRGDFAFVVIDEARRRLFCARDAFGARPLYYAEARGRIACASEPAALTLLSGVPRRADLEQVALLLSGAYNEAERTVFDGIRSLGGGHSLSADGSMSQLRRFWAPDPWRRIDVDLEGAADLVREQVSQTLQRRLQDGGVAIYLSGGLDSAVVASEVARQRAESGGARPTVVHACFPGSEDDETRYSAAVAEMWDLPQINCRPLDQPDRLAPSLDRSPDVWWDPRLGMWEELCEVSREAGLTQGLTGDGVDECLAGTGSEWADDLSPGGIRRAFRESGVSTRPWSRSRWQQLLRGGLLPRFPRLGVHLDGADDVLTPRFSACVKEHRLDRASRHASRSYPNLVNRDLCAPFEEGDTNVVLSSNERIGARSGIEIREALMDVDLVELLLSLPHEHRHTVGFDKPKPVLRRAMRDVLPEIVTSRQTSGTYVDVFSRVLFGAPVNAVKRVFSGSSRLQEAGLIAQRTAERLRKEPSQPPPGYGRGSWALQATSLVAMEILLRQL